ncbi:MAG: 2-amino-4-hydroxy-6-hydroxymethyldihydropteridine diphosphokinase [Chloroflexi bacterium]|nr:2-amino-4-hydroxy-6-hydroxymethyldihydropteridine diphosphokinase [Chloroflexota bacterium]
MNHTIYLALGTNLGDRQQNLATALRLLEPQVQGVQSSPIYETAPWGYLEQDNFLNIVVRGQTHLTPLQLFNLVKTIENEMGRVKIIQDGPRLIDIDILFYDNQLYNSPTLEIPHPRMRGRSFVLVPLADLAPDFIHPVYHLTIRQLAAETDPSTLWPYNPRP